MPERIPGKKFEQIPWATLDALGWRQEKSKKRPLVRIVRCASRLLDPTNLRGSFKALEDRLCDARLILGDKEEDFDCEILQVKVKKKDQATYLLIDYPE